MPPDNNPLDLLRLERTAPRVRRLFGTSAGPMAGVGPNAEAVGTQESSGRRVGPPNAEDARLIARQLKAAGGAASDPAAADALAATLVSRAHEALADLLNGGSNGALGLHNTIALEAVMHARGRPALRVVDGPGLEPIDDAKHPGSDIWRVILDDHEAALVKVAAATGAVVVRDKLIDLPAWVQGTAWSIGGDRFVTNRHVLFPPGGMPLARRRPDNKTAARLKSDLEITIDLAFDNGPVREQKLPVIEVIFVAEEHDPVDVAILRVQPPAGIAMPPKLELSPNEFGESRLFVVGHPGRMPLVPEKVQAVFGSPDERKRVSFGELMDADAAYSTDLIHDASTIGGYSGGCVLGFLSPGVVGLHYYGDSQQGNRAVLATALKPHAVGQYF